MIVPSIDILPVAEYALITWLGAAISFGMVLWGRNQ